SLKYAGFLPEFDMDVFDHLNVVDFGDVEIVDDLAQSISNVRDKVHAALAAGLRVVTIGGFSPCASYGVAAGVSKAAEGEVGVLSLDAHADSSDVSMTGDRGPNGSTWEARMWEDFPNINPRLHSEIGVRGPRNNRLAVDKY